MNILMFNYEYPPIGGGGGIVHSLLAEELARRHRVCVITSAYGDHAPRHENHNGVEIHRVPVVGRTDRDVATVRSLMSYVPAAWLRAMTLLRREAFEVINAHFAVPTGVASVHVARLANLPHVMTLHGGDIYDPSKSLSPHRIAPLRWTIVNVLRRSDRVVADSTNTRDNVYRYYNYRDPIDVIPLGIRKPEVPQASRADLGLPSRVFLAVTVGRLVKRKALDELLKAVKRCGCEAVHLVVVGGGPERTQLERLTAELGLVDRVHFMGYVDETRKWQILECSDAYVSSSMHEGFGLVYLEAMAAGLPVITYDHGGQTDFLRDGDTGVLVRVGHLEALAVAIRRLAAAPDLIARIGRSNRTRWEEHRIERCANAYEALFERAVDVQGATRTSERGDED
ncbi:MAG: glycosyltransferase family 4 protein [Gemmatimonadota bacterium]